MIYRFRFLEGEYFWGGCTVFGTDMPIKADSNYERDFRIEPRNQMTPLFLSSKGRYIWSDHTFKVWVENGELCFDSLVEMELHQAGTCLRDAYLEAMKKHFPFDFGGKTLPREFFKTAQYNTWMEFTYDPYQEGVLEYARSINGCKCIGHASTHFAQRMQTVGSVDLISFSVSAIIAPVPLIIGTSVL